MYEPSSKVCTNAALGKKADDVIPKDVTLAYSSDDKDYGNAFDLFFTNAKNVCPIDSCVLK